MADGTAILPCDCKHDFQDKTYGKGMRVHNRGDKKGTANAGKYFCTVCCPSSRNKYRTTISAAPAMGMFRDIIGVGARKAKDAGSTVQTLKL